MRNVKPVFTVQEILTKFIYFFKMKYKIKFFVVILIQCSITIVFGLKASTVWTPVVVLLDFVAYKYWF